MGGLTVTLIAFIGFLGGGATTQAERARIKCHHEIKDYSACYFKNKYGQFCTPLKAKYKRTDVVLGCNLNPRDFQ